LHLEHYYDLYDGGAGRAKEEIEKLIPHLPTDKKTVLIVAGDLATVRRPQRIVTFFELLQPRFKHIIYVLGNHEHYGDYLQDTENLIRAALRLSPNLDMSKITMAGNYPVEKTIDGVRFILGTMWTDYRNGDYETACLVPKYISDHKMIKDVYPASGMLTTAKLAEIHRDTLAGFGKWMEDKDNSKTVVVTHHMPTYQAVDPRYMLDPVTRVLNAAFVTNLDEFILKHQPALWFFGHTHTPFYGKIGDTQLHCNPLGYPNERLDAYDSTKIYTL
jgi:predicted phosphodiesterase